MTKRKDAPNEAATSHADFDAQIADVRNGVREKVNNQAQSDEDLALEYLGCKETQDGEGRVTFGYVKPGSDRERECLSAIGRLLRSSADLSTGIRWRLATLFDPSEATVESRKLVLRRRRPGGANEPTEARSIAIARFLAEQVSAGRTKEHALSLAQDRYSVSRSTAERAWDPIWLAPPSDGLN